jgi:chemotaxis protein MotA
MGMARGALMFVIIGIVVVFGSVMLGYILHGGKIAVLIQPTEIIIIFGAAIGAMVISAGPPVLKSLVNQILATMKPPHVNKEFYTKLLLLLFELCKTAKANPLSLEPHVEKPEESEIFKRYPEILHHHHVVDFLCDTLKIQISSPMSPYDLEDLMNADIDAAHAQEHVGPTLLGKIGDAMPGLGIVAAVLGVVITMGKLTQGKEVIGHSVAAALVGTFMGVFAAYGLIQPLVSKIELNLQQEHGPLNVIKAALIAFSKDCSPKVCVEFARRTVAPAHRPTFAEVDQATSNVGKAA